MIHMTIQSQAIQAWLTRAAASGRNLTPMLKNMGEELLNSTLERFDKSLAPDGSAWAPNSPVTLARKRGSQPLVGETGLLSTEIDYQVSGHELVLASNKGYAAMQQFGGTRSRFGHLWGDIPARPFLGLSTADEQALLEIAEDYLTR